MRTVTTIAALRDGIRRWRQSGLSISLAPTMGNLHGGHLRLLAEARQCADKAVVSIFVNPAQFGVNEDFHNYPRTVAQDQALLRAHGADLLFLPSVAEMYPQGAAETLVSVRDLAKLHCGVSRPGHFDGVALIVCKLLNLVQPDVLLLGEKDFQQLSVIRRLVADLNFPVEVRGVATVREADGLAMSSRNSYLSEEQRELAPKLYQALCAVRAAISAGERDYPAVLASQAQTLQAAGFTLEYFSVCRSSDLMPAAPDDENLVILLAAKLGATRLIDNINFWKQSPK